MPSKTLLQVRTTVFSALTLLSLVATPSHALTEPPMGGMIEIGYVEDVSTEEQGPELGMVVGVEFYGNSTYTHTDVQWFLLKGQALIASDGSGVPAFDFTVIPLLVDFNKLPITLRALPTTFKRNVYLDMDQRVSIHVVGFSGNLDEVLLGRKDGTHLSVFANAGLDLLGFTFATQTYTGREFYGMNLVDAFADAGAGFSLSKTISLRVTLMGYRAPVVHSGVTSTGYQSSEDGEYLLREAYNELALQLNTAVGRFSIFAQRHSADATISHWNTATGGSGGGLGEIFDPTDPFNGADFLTTRKNHTTLRIGVRASVR